MEFQRYSVCFWTKGGGGIYTKCVGARNKSQGNMGLRNFRFFFFLSENMGINIKMSGEQVELKREENLGDLTQVPFNS